MTIRRAALQWAGFISCMLIAVHVASSICRTQALSTSLVLPGATLTGYNFRRPPSFLRDLARSQPSKKAPAMEVEPFVEDKPLEDDTVELETVLQNVSVTDKIEPSVLSNGDFSQQTNQPSESDEDNSVKPEQQSALQVNNSSIYNDNYASEMDVSVIEQAELQASISNPEQQPVVLYIPSVRRILEFSIPAIAVWLCCPLLSVIDTSTVGLYVGTAQQAALNPAIAIVDYSARCLSFLYTGTTNMVAIAQEKDKQAREPSQTSETFLGALQLSLLVGVSLGALVIAFSKPMLRALIGNDLISPEVTSAAWKYVVIRALGMPATAMIGTSQAACLGMRDVQSPLKVVLFAAVINLVLDLALVDQPQPWIGGAAGAAWATLISQYIALALFLKRLGTTTPRKASKKGLQCTKGILSGRLRLGEFFRRPSADTSNGFRPYVVPVTVTQVGRCSTYVAMGHVVSSSFGTVSMAANQIITAIFYTLIPIADSLSLTAQSFLPGLFLQDASRERTNAIRKTILNLLKVAGLFGLFLSGIVACIPAACPWFTTSPAVMAQVTSVVPVLLTIFSLHGIFCASEGILLGQRDLRFLGRMYGAYFVVVPWLMLRIKTAKTSGLKNVWDLFLGYQLFRILAWVCRVLVLQRRLEKLADDLGSCA